jgi:hypothetical protein
LLPFTARHRYRKVKEGLATRERLLIRRPPPVKHLRDTPLVAGIGVVQHSMPEAIQTRKKHGWPLMYVTAIINHHRVTSHAR